MAYVIWRVVMKKYSRVRLGLNGSGVTPTGRHVLTYDEESWKPTEDHAKSKESLSEITRTNETRQSKTKRVKNYLKKCKNALGSKNSGGPDHSNGEISGSSWYIDKGLEDIINESEVNVLEDVYEDVLVSTDLGDFSSIQQKANVVEVKGRENTGCVADSRENSGVVGDSAKTTSPVVGDVDNSDKNGTNFDNTEAVLVESSPLLPVMQKEVEGTIGDVLEVKEKPQEPKEEKITEAKQDVASLVDKYFGKLYENYGKSKKSLVRQARNVLVCEYHGCLQKFENEYCHPAAKLLQHLKNERSAVTCNPSGWPLCLGTTGIVIHLGALDPSLLRNKDCYLCLRNRSSPGVELSLICRKASGIHCHTLAEFSQPVQNLDEIMCSTTLKNSMDLEKACLEEVNGSDLPEMLQNLLVSVEHAIERVPLDDLSIPCPQCCQYLPVSTQEDSPETVCSCQCLCRSENSVQRKDTSIQTSPMFEFVGSIPHIDSDEEDDKDSIKSGTSVKKLQEMTMPNKITDLPDKLLMSGINLPGTEDVDGRPIVLCYAECIARAGLNKYEVAKILLYYASIPASDTMKKGFTILLLAETEDNNKVLETLDKAACLVGNIIKITRFLVWKPSENGPLQRKTLSSRIETVIVSDETTFGTFISKDQAPASCGGSCNHDQLEWVEFFKQLEPFLETCRSVGRALLLTLSQLRNEDVPSQINRRFLNHQCRQISKALQLECLQKLRTEGPKTLSSLEERSQWLSNSKDVKRSATFAYNSMTMVERVAKRLEELNQERMERLKELGRLRTLQTEAEELLSWIRNVGEESLNSSILSLRTAADISAVKTAEKDFEQFYFNALRQIDKASDLVEESNNIKDMKGKNLKESSNNLKAQMKPFGEHLEETRERFEDTCRCFLLLESCQDILEDDNKETEEFKKLAFKSGNEALIKICKATKQLEKTEPVQPPDRMNVCSANLQEVATSTPIKPQNTQIRRRSVSSHAYIYHCNHHAAGEFCNCYESDSENTVSYKLKKKYIQLQNCVCYANRDTIERKNSVTLDGIKEERESVENLLEKIDRSDNECGRYDSGLSTADNSVGDDSTVYNNKKKLQRTCSCQYFRESCALCSAASSSTGSNQDHTENQQDSIIEEGSDGFVKSSSSDDIEEEHYSEERRKVPPIPANSHLHCHASTLDLPTDAFYPNMDPKTQKTLLLIMREMIQTERDYVKSLDYIIENYLPELNRHDIPQALRGQRNVVFGNVEKIYEFHSQFFLRELEQCENNPLQVGQIFLKYDKRFYLYALYNKNKPKSDSLMSEYGSAFFKSKQLELGDKMDLASYLLKPVQRMGKYALLLQQMMKACPALPPGASERIVTEQDDLKLAEEMVRFQLRHGNDLLAMDSIRECDVNLKEQGRLLRQNEFLVWEGRSGKKSLRQVFLFEELILFSKARRFPDRKNLDLYIYKNSIKMTDIGLTAKIEDHPNKFEIWFRKRKPNDTFTLQSISEDVKKAWTEELSQLLWKQAIKNREVRMAEMSSMGIGNKPCLDIRPSADQINDRSISFAQLSRTAPRFRNSIVGPTTELCRSTKRPHSVISMSSMSSSSTSSGGSGGATTSPPTLLNLSFDTSCDSPKPYHRSATLNSQCSMESGIIADMSLGSDECSENIQATHWPLEKSISQHSNASTKSSSTTPTQSDDTQITSYHVPEDIPVNI